MKKIAIGLALAISVIVALTATQPTDYTIEKSIEINKPVSSIFSKVADYKIWPLWSPWLAKDPAMIITYAPQTIGVGARQDWISKTEGTGFQIVTEFIENKKLASELTFTAPWEGKAFASFSFEAIADDKTKVIWTMIGKNNSVVDKFFYMILGINKMIADDMASGLNSLSKLN